MSAEAKIALYGRAAKLSRTPDIMGYTRFAFEATHIAVALFAPESSPFHDFPDETTFDVTIGIDPYNAPAEVLRIAREFVRHGRRPCFGPPLPDTEPMTGGRPGKYTRQDSEDSARVAAAALHAAAPLTVIDLEQSLLRAAIDAANRGDAAGAARLTNAYKRLSRVQGYVPEKKL